MIEGWLCYMYVCMVHSNVLTPSSPTPVWLRLLQGSGPHRRIYIHVYSPVRNMHCSLYRQGCLERIYFMFRFRLGRKMKNLVLRLVFRLLALF